MNVFVTLGKEIADILVKYYPTYLNGALQTLLLALAGTAAGCLIGFICGILQTIPCSKRDPLIKRILLGIIRFLIRLYVEVFRGTPMILQAVFIYYGIPFFSGATVHLDVVAASYLVVSINTGAYMAETVRGGILSIDPGQTEGAKAIGMNHFQTMLYVIIPQMLRNILPQIANNLIINIKDTSVMFIIGFTELFAVHKSVTGAHFVYFPSAVITMGIYLIMTVASSVLLRLFESKLQGPENFDISTTDTLAHTSGMFNYTPGTKKEVR